MTLPFVVRVFFAIDLPAATKKKLSNFIGLIKKKSKPHAIRWVKEENLHITLQFLAEVKNDDLPHLINTVREEIEGKVKKMSLAFGALRLFPNPYRPRVIVLDLDPPEVLAELAARIGAGIIRAHYSIDTRPFRGHLTLGRIKQPQGLDLNFLNEFSAPSIESLPLQEVTLFRSQPQPEGSMYSILEKITFAGLDT